MVNTHSVLQTRPADWQCAARQARVERQEVEVRLRGIGRVGDGVSEAVGLRRIVLEAGGAVHDLVSDEA